MLQKQISPKVQQLNGKMGYCSFMALSGLRESPALIAAG